MIHDEAIEGAQLEEPLGFPSQAFQSISYKGSLIIADIHM
jgi:hypothetical protein